MDLGEIQIIPKRDVMEMVLNREAQIQDTHYHITTTGKCNFNLQEDFKQTSLEMKVNPDNNNSNEAIR